MNWEQAQVWEENWHNNNPFIYREQLKQEVYAEKMGLTKDYPDYKLCGLKVLDIGGGECSILLKYKDVNASIVEPLIMRFPNWIRARYLERNFKLFPLKGENIDVDGFDEVWIYNVLQHTESPEKVIKKAKVAGKIIRIFEWIETPVTDGHIHTLHAKDLDKWLGGEGKTEQLNDRDCVGLAYFGIFPT